MGYAKISQGGLSNTIIDIRLIAKYAIDVLAASVILVHNHPSGSVLPSSCDNELTRRVAQGLKLLNIKLLDHIIISEDNYYSFSDEGAIY